MWSCFICNRFRAIARCFTVPVVLCAIWLAAPAAYAVTTLPDAADAGRVQAREAPPALERSESLNLELQRAPQQTEIPPGVEKVPFKLLRLNVEGASIFTQEELYPLYREYVGRQETLASAWIIADRITRYYRERGYFLSRAIVPEQALQNGALTIKVVEGHIGEIVLDHPLSHQPVIQESMADLKLLKPITVDALESFLLRLNDLQDANFRTVLTPIQNADESNNGAVRLLLVPAKKPSRITAQVDNYGSRFLGPHQGSLTYVDSFLPLQKTTVSLLTSLPLEELRYGVIEHAVQLTPEIELNVNGGITRAHPGFNIRDFDIESDSRSLGVTLDWQAIRQRQRNLSFSAGIDGRNTLNDIAGSPLTRDKIRAVRLGAAFDSASSVGGFTAGNLELARGIPGLGSSDARDDFLSRAAAAPDFTKATLSLNHFQQLTSSVLLVASMSGQYATDALYAAEEFGYGGQAFGRAYDPSELTGDSGVAGALELRYLADGWSEDIQFTPYAFYDHGLVWNRDAGQASRLAASSAGVGLTATLPSQFSANLGLAFPMTREVVNPIYGGSASGPRVLLKISKEF